MNMKVNALTTFNSSNINNNNKQYASKPVFKQDQFAGIAQRAIVDQFIESANSQKNSKNQLVNRLNYLKEVLFSGETTRRAKELQDIIDSYDSQTGILFKI